jgi:hypothetical protein
MKTIILLSLFLVSNLFATTHYKISQGSLHNGGKLEVNGVANGENAEIKIDYEISAKRFIPRFLRKHLAGKHTETLPKEFLFEEAYLDLENNGSIEIKDAFVYHQGRVSIGRYTRAHKVFIVAKNGKSEITAYYHPQIEDAGWAFIHLKIKKIPVLGSYELKASVKN